MNNRRTPQKTFNPRRVLNKLLLSGFVVISFVLYAINKPFSSADATANVGSASQDPQALTQNLVPPTPPAVANSGASPTQAPVPTQLPTNSPTAAPQQAFLPTPVPPTAAPTTVPALSSTGYKDGTYTGPEIDVMYGLVRVQAVIQNGKIKSVQFLEFPQDRRTSARINSIAVPDLVQEAVQTQSANVNIITGATLTSEGFIMSLQSALANSHS